MSTASSQPAAGGPDCTLTLDAEHASYASADEASLLAFASLQAPSVQVDASRAPLELVAVIDRSGSMSGQKMLLVKQSLKLLIDRSGLQAQDKLGVVTFDHEVQVALPLTSMDKTGKQKASAAVDGVCLGGTTNLSGGLIKGLQMLCESDEASREAAADAADDEEAVVVDDVTKASRSLLLFTDGHANAGITDGGAIVAAALALLKDHPSTAIFTFGYGDHDDALMRGLAEASRGLFYFVAQPDAIPTAFADCLGGLSSVVCQNATLELRPAGGWRATATIAEVLDTTTYQVSLGEHGSRATLSLGDLYGDDEKDVLLRLALAPLAAPADAAEAVLEATLSYYSVHAKRFEHVEATLRLARPISVDPAATTPNLKLDEQRNRMHAAEAIEKASALADNGNRDAGKRTLLAACATLGASPSSRTPTSRALQADLERLALDYEDAHTYHSAGSKRSKAASLSHRQQRDATSWDTYSAPTPSDLPYKSGKAGKSSMSYSWTTGP